MKNIFYKIWTVWCVVVLLLVLLLVFPFLAIILWVAGDKGIKPVNLVINLLPRIGLFLFCMRSDFHFESAPEKRPCVYISNHRSFLDILLAIHFAKPGVRFLGKVEAFSWPMIGYFATKLGHIPVKREHKEARAESYEAMRSVSERGNSVFLFPEGKIPMDDKLLHSFRPGAFRLAIETQQPMVVITMINAGVLMPSNGFSLRPGKCINYVSASIETKGMGEEDIPVLMERVWKMMEANLLKHYPDNKYPITFDPKDYAHVKTPYED